MDLAVSQTYTNESTCNIEIPSFMAEYVPQTSTLVPPQIDPEAKDNKMHITVSWSPVDSLPALRRVPTAYSPTPELEGLAESLNRVSDQAGEFPRTECDFCGRPFPQSGEVPALDDLTIVSRTGQASVSTRGPWFLCRDCEVGLRLDPAVQSISLLRVRRYYTSTVLPHLQREMEAQVGRQAVSRMSAELFGPG